MRLDMFRKTAMLLFFVLALATETFAQNVTIELKNATLVDFFNEIEKQTDYRISYRVNILDKKNDITMSVKKVPVPVAFDKALIGRNLKYEIISSTSIIVSEKVLSHLSDKKFEIKGKVIDSTGEAIIGATVLEKGTNNGTITNADGEYFLEVSSPNAEIDITYIGYQKKTIKILGKNNHVTTLQEDSKLIDEVVVVGYGTQKRGNLTGAISSINSDEILTSKHSSLAQNLEGKIPGLQIRQQSGEPGSYDTSINIRGFGTPLFVIDGIVRDGSADFQRLTPNDIESISVLKDASAAIYGLNAANGVILITTKKGIEGRPQFSYDGTFGWQKPTDIPEMCNAAQYLELVNDANVNAGLNPSISKEELAKWRQGIPGYESTDWYNEAIKGAAPTTQQNFSIRGGNKSVNYFLSFGYLSESGLLKSNDMSYDKYSLRSNVTANLNRYLTADVMISGRIDEREYPGDDFYWIFKSTRMNLPTERPYANNNKDYLADVTLENNPVAMMQKDVAGYTQTKNKVFQSSATLNYDAPFLAGLNFKGTISYDSYNTAGKSLKKKYNAYTYIEETDEYVSSPYQDPSRITNSITDNNRLVVQGLINYNKTFSTDHVVGAMLGYESRKQWSRYSYLKREYDFYTNDQINQASKNNQETDGYETEEAYMSYIGRFNYSYLSKYLLEFAFRYDGTYRYSPDHRWGFFPVISGGWRISEEDFIKNNFDFIDNLKIRASYGIVGENSGSPFQYVPGFNTTGGGYYEFTDGEFTSGASSPNIVNPDLTWYRSRITDIGLDLGLFNGKLNFEIDFYKRYRTGLLAKRNASLPNTFGGSLPDENLNSDKVQGFDLMISHRNKINEFTYGISANLNFARTMQVYTERAPYRSSWDKWTNGNTNRYNDIIWGYNCIGQYQTKEEIYHGSLVDGSIGNVRLLPGDFVYEDVNGDGLIDSKDMLPSYWNGTPKVHFGLTLDAQYKGFDLNVLFQGAANYTIRFSEIYSEVLCFKGNTPLYFYDRWHLADPYDPNSEWIPGKWMPARFSENMSSNYRESQVWRKDASYVRLKTIELGYTIPQTFSKKYGIESLRVYVNGYNLLTFADPFVKPFDPEKLEGKYNAGLTYPLTKIFNIGVNIRF